MRSHNRWIGASTVHGITPTPRAKLTAVESTVPWTRRVLSRAHRVLSRAHIDDRAHRKREMIARLVMRYRDVGGQSGKCLSGTDSVEAD